MTDVNNDCVKWILVIDKMDFRYEFGHDFKDTFLREFIIVSALALQHPLIL